MMSAADILSVFVRDALTAGRSRPEIRGALEDSGWSESEINKALAAFADVDFSPPIPRPRQQLTARDVFVYAMMFTALGFTAVFLINLIHGSLEIWLPDSSDNQHTSLRATRTIRWAIAVLLVSAPVFAWLTIKNDRRIAQDAAQRRSSVRKWLTYLTLFISALTFLIDASIVINNFLNGEITLRFILKALTVACVSAAIFIYYLRDVEEMKDDQ
jgi:cytochrome bd-type quinol oxidase subunit 2